MASLFLEGVHFEFVIEIVAKIINIVTLIHFEIYSHFF